MRPSRSLYDLEPGVETRWIQPGESFGSVPVGHRLDELKAELRGRPASLELIALQDGVRFYLIFALDPRDPPPVALTVVYEPGVAAPVTTADFSGAFGGPPLEFIRFDHYHGVHQYEVLAAAESFHEREKRWAEERARMNTAPPPDHN